MTPKERKKLRVIEPNDIRPGMLIYWVGSWEVDYPKEETRLPVAVVIKLMPPKAFIGKEWLTYWLDRDWVRNGDEVVAEDWICSYCRHLE
jgi:hypothetical protein